MCRKKVADEGGTDNAADGGKRQRIQAIEVAVASLAEAVRGLSIDSVSTYLETCISAVHEALVRIDCQFFVLILSDFRCLSLVFIDLAMVFMYLFIGFHGCCICV